MFLKISQLSQENTCVGVFLIKLQAFRSAIFLKRNFNTGVSCEIYEILKNTYIQEHLQTTASLSEL